MRNLRRYQVVVVTLVVLVATISTSLAQDSVVHVVQPGENLYRIALRYGVTMEALIQANNIADASRVFSGQELLIPGISAPDSGTEVVNPLIASTPTIHVVQPGENLNAIANKYGVTVEQILQANNIANPDRIFRGQELQIWTLENSADEAVIIPEETLNVEPVEPAAPVPTNTTYIVQPGEHLAQIAQRFGVSWPVIAQMNGIANPDRVFAGQELIIPALNPSGGVADLGIMVPSGPGATITRGKQIVVDLSEQRIYAYQDGGLLRNVVVSTGLPGTPTVQGDYAVYVKYTAQTMSGPGYYLPDVPYVMYFYQGYGIHGTYWHSNFGQPMSHGCVNLPTPEAEWFFNWAEVGTPVHVRV
jgi:LysM repeat protein